MQHSISRLAVLVLVLASPIAVGAQEPADSMAKPQPPYLQAVLVERGVCRAGRNAHVHQRRRADSNPNIPRTALSLR